MIKFKILIPLMGRPLHGEWLWASHTLKNRSIITINIKLQTETFLEIETLINCHVNSILMFLYDIIYNAYTGQIVSHKILISDIAHLIAKLKWQWTRQIAQITDGAENVTSGRYGVKVQGALQVDWAKVVGWLIGLHRSTELLNVQNVHIYSVF